MRGSCLVTPQLNQASSLNAAKEKEADNSIVKHLRLATVVGHFVARSHAGQLLFGSEPVVIEFHSLGPHRLNL